MDIKKTKNKDKQGTRNFLYQITTYYNFKKPMRIELVCVFVVAYMVWASCVITWPTNDEMSQRPR